MSLAARSLASGPRTGMPPATAASKRNGDLGPAGDRFQLRAVVGDDVLVRGDDRLAGREGGRDERVRGLVAAHQLDDDVDVGRGHEVGRRVGQQLGRDPGLAGLVEVAAGHADELERRAVGRRGAGRAGPAAHRTTAPPTVPAPRTATRKAGWVDIPQMVADGHSARRPPWSPAVAG